MLPIVVLAREDEGEDWVCAEEWMSTEWSRLELTAEEFLELVPSLFSRIVSTARLLPKNVCEMLAKTLFFVATAAAPVFEQHNSDGVPLY